MTSTLKVDPQVYYDAATSLNRVATTFYQALETHWGALAQCDSSAGSYEEARTWAASYDEHSIAVISQLKALARAAGNYATVVQMAGYNYAVAEWNATTGEKGAAPARPVFLAPPIPADRIPPPSVGGPGQGLDDTKAKVIGLVEKIGIVIPDGNATKLSNLADTWRQVAESADLAGLPAELDRIAAQFDGVDAPELAFVTQDVVTLKESTQAVLDAAREMGRACEAFREALDQLRDKLKEMLEDLGKQLAKELAITYAIGAVASAVTFGVGLAVATARALEITAEAAGPIRTSIIFWKGEKKISEGVKVSKDLKSYQKELKRLEELGKDAKAAATKPASLTKTESDAIIDYTGSGHQFSNIPLRAGTVTPQQQEYINTLNRALDKLPNYEGPVTRITNLTPEQIAAYRKIYETKGTRIEEAFTSTSPFKDAGGVRDGNVEFRIFSRTGKDISSYGPNPEILFKTDTPFKVTKVATDWSTGRTVIQMVEKVG
ncbi:MULTISPECIES: ADP-ribosyltransferase [unclassified Nocardia]|uniref:ADP-ribosyltransferase n=1 Tax=unclassified Nocardia TaxID=2637762 RepID=UPI001CE3F6B6|nr:MULTISPECIES: ADP-ribosyltransferase [unclassified Nocardia]